MLYNAGILQELAIIDRALWTMGILSLEGGGSEKHVVINGQQVLLIITNGPRGVYELREDGGWGDTWGVIGACG